MIKVVLLVSLSRLLTKKKSYSIRLSDSIQNHVEVAVEQTQQGARHVTQAVEHQVPYQKKKKNLAALAKPSINSFLITHIN